MEVMHEAGIVDDTGIVNVTETDLDQLSKRHESEGLLLLENSIAQRVFKACSAALTVQHLG